MAVISYRFAAGHADPSASQAARMDSGRASPNGSDDVHADLRELL
jgi:hypothetical protein